MQVVCEICDKVCSNISSFSIKNGQICVDCEMKLKGYLGKGCDLGKINSVEYKDMLIHPIKVKMIRKKANSEKKEACLGCGKLEIKNLIDEQHGLCRICSMAVHTITGTYNYKEKLDFSSHDIKWYENELEECYSPCDNIIFNFKKKEFFLKIFLRKIIR